MALFFSGGTPPIRVFFFLAFFTALAKPWWGLQGIALLGPLFLVDQGRHPGLLGIDGFVLGAILGHLLRWNPSARAQTESSGLAVIPQDAACAPDRRGRGFFAGIAWALAFGVLAAILPGLYLLFASGEPLPENESLYALSGYALIGFPTSPAWSLRCAINWLTGLLLAWVVWRETSAPNFLSFSPSASAQSNIQPFSSSAQADSPADRLRRLWILAGVSGAVAAAIGIGEFFHWIPLWKWRPDNPDLSAMGSHRLVSLAGHSGWFAQWLVLTWPGLLLAWGGGWKRRWTVGGLLAIMALALLLTLQRAGWLGGGVAAAIALGCAWQKKAFSRRKLLVAFGTGAILLLIVALALHGGQILERVAHLLRFGDRRNYYITTWHLLHLFPRGVGIGLHFVHYQSLFTHFLRVWQYDHVTAHSTWLHVLVEQGPWQASVLAIGVAGVAVTAWRGWRRSRGDEDKTTRAVLFALGLAWAGMMVESMAQFIGYIRVVEVMMWIAAGGILGLASNAKIRALSIKNIQSGSGESAAELDGAAGIVKGAKSSSGETPAPARGPRLLVQWPAALLILLGGIAAADTARHHAARFLANPTYPRPIYFDPASNGLHIWTRGRWRFPLDPVLGGLEFCIRAGAIPQRVQVRVPDNPPLDLRLAPGEQRCLWFAIRTQKAAGLAAPLRWMEIDCAPTWVPVLEQRGATDHRVLGAYVFALRPLFADTDPRRPAAQTWKESSGGMPRPDVPAFR